MKTLLIAGIGVGAFFASHQIRDPFFLPGIYVTPFVVLTSISLFMKGWKTVWAAIGVFIPIAVFHCLYLYDLHVWESKRNGGWANFGLGLLYLSLPLIYTATGVFAWKVPEWLGFSPRSTDKIVGDGDNIDRSQLRLSAKMILCVCIGYQLIVMLTVYLVPVTGYIFPYTNGIDVVYYVHLLQFGAVSVVAGVAAAVAVRRLGWIVPQLLLAAFTIAKVMYG